MDDLYVKDDEGNYVPVTLEVASSRDLADKLIVVTVGSDEEPASIETLEYVQKRFIQSKVIIEAMKRSKDANLLILPHIIKLELISRRDLDTKTVCIRLNTDDDIQNLPELRDQLKDTIRKDVVILPAPLSLSEYKEVKAIKDRVRIRKQRNGGGLNTSQK
jgi:hypothetical protein